MRTTLILVTLLMASLVLPVSAHDETDSLYIGDGGTRVLLTLPRPRLRLELAENAEYHHCRAAILRFLHEGSARPVAKAA
jgi:hypothetical protein